MIYLLLSILTSTLTVSFFKLFEIKKVHTFQAIIANYITCSFIGSAFSHNHFWTPQIWQSEWFLYTAVLGLLFISIFYFIALTAQKISVSASMVSAKLSVVIPVLLAWIFYGETLSMLKITGIVLSLIAVVFISSRKDETHHENGWALLFFPAMVFLGSGAIDSLLNYLEEHFIPPYTADEIITSTFFFAFVWGLLALSIPAMRGQEGIKLRNMLWGVALGIPNYFSMYFLVMTLGVFPATYIFPINNIGIVGASTLLAFILFKERLSLPNYLGLLLASVAILLIAFS